MPIYSFYRIVKDIIRTIFGGKFWRKFLIIISISIAIWFVLHNKGYCVEETEDINYSMYSYYDNLTNEAITKIARYYLRDSNNWLFNAIKNNNASYGFYFYYGAIDGSDYLGSTPFNNNIINLYVYNNNSNLVKSITSFDYLGITGKSIYKYNNSNNSSIDIRKFMGDNSLEISTTNFVYMPIALYNYKTTNWLKFEDYVRNGDISSVVQLLNEIKDQNDTILEEMTQDVQDTSQGVVDTSIVDTSGTAQATQNVQSLLGIIQGFYNNIGDEVYTITFPIKNTSFSIRSDIISSHISGTWLATFLNTFWYFIFGMYYLIFLFRIGKWLADGSLFEERRCS